jgi:hypothetical protein
MSSRVIRVEPIAPYRLDVEFDDGVYGTIDLSDRLFGEMFEPLRDEQMFRAVSIDKFGAVSWPNGADLAPDAMHETLIKLRFPPSAKGHAELPPEAISGRADCLEQLLLAFRDLADRDDIGQAAARLALVEKWIEQESRQSQETPNGSDVRRASA